MWCVSQRTEVALIMQTNVSVLTTQSVFQAGVGTEASQRHPLSVCLLCGTRFALMTIAKVLWQ